MQSWALLRPDTSKALEYTMVKKILPRYIKTVNDELPANFQIAKRIVFDFDKSMSDRKLWEEHRVLMEKFYETKEVIDKGKLRLEDLEVPAFSLLDLKIILAKNLMKKCELCEWKCGVDRTEGNVGKCRVGNRCLISSQFIHMGEEPFLSPSHTIFFMGCNFKCQFCQNWEISQWHESGTPVTPQIMADIIGSQRKNGARNVNFVGGEPTPSLLWVLETLKYCGENIPTIWNSNMYMSEASMSILDGAVDVYLSDFKYGNDECALSLSKIPNFFETCARNHLLAAKQAEITLRHLIMPDHIDCCTKPVLEWVANNIKDNCIVNLMDQYRPDFKSNQHIDINRRITQEEFEKAFNHAKRLKINFMS